MREFGKMICVLMPLVLVGCDTPSIKFRGIDPVRISVGKSTFDVRIDGDRAEAIRINTEWAPRLEAVAPRAVAAIEKVSGCKVTKLGGDQAMILARLKCSGGTGPMIMDPGPTGYECDIDENQRPLGNESLYVTCRPVYF